MSWATGLAYLRAIIWPAVTVGLLLYFHRPVRDVLKALAERMPYLKSVQGPGVGLDYYEAKFIQASAEASSLKAIGAAAEASLASATEEPTTEPPALRDEPGERAATRVNRRVEMSIIDPDPHTDDEPLFREWRAEQMTPKVDLAELAKHSPQTTIVVAWQQLDAIIRMLYRELNPHPPLGDTPGILGQASSVTFELGDAGLLDGGASSVILSALMNLIELRDSVAKRTPSQLEAYQYAYSADQLAGTLRQGVKLMQRKAANAAPKVEQLAPGSASRPIAGRCSAEPLTAAKPLWRDPAFDLPTGCTRRGRRCARCAFLPFSPLGRGFLAGRFASSNDLPHKDFRRGLPRFQHDALQANLAIVCGVREVARRAGASRAKVALAWVLAQGKHVVPIPGTKTPKFLADNAGAANVVLSAADQAELDACRHRLAYPLLRHPCQPCGDTVRLLISRNCHSYKQPIAVAARDRCNGYQGALSCGDSLSC